MSEREMLERAAAAAGIELKWPVMHGKRVEGHSPRRTDTWDVWNPLTDDGDALRLAVRLKLNIAQGDFSAGVDDEAEVSEHSLVRNEEERAQVVRLLITRAAAALAPTAQGE